METIDIKQRITQGENVTTEFKENFHREVIETTVAFANTIGQTWDRLLVASAGRDDIDAQKVQWYLTRREAIRNVTKPQDMSLTELLVNIHGISAEETPTHAGILFFSKQPQRFFQNAQLRVVRFKGTSVLHPVIDRLDCSGALWEMVTAAEEFIRKNIRLLSFRSETSFQRDDKFEYPLSALREAITNALIHRNYQEPADVRVFIFDQRVEIINPGTFPEGVSPDAPVHNPVNPTLSQLMYDVGFIERYGAGIKMMCRLCEDWGNKKPCYEFHPLETKIIFDSPIQETTFVEIDDMPSQLNERQRNALFYVQSNGKIATKDYIDLNRVSRGTAYAELKDLTSKGLLTVIGKGRGIRYVRKLSDY